MIKEFNEKIKGKKVAILGLGVSNKPLVEYFHKLGCHIEIFSEQELDYDNNYQLPLHIGGGCFEKLTGFDYIFRSPSILPTREELLREKENGCIITSEIEEVITLAPCKVVAVTGTEGKTTTTSLIYEICKNKYKSYIGGNIGKPIFTKLNEIQENDLIILELSSFQLMNMEVSPSVAVVTNMFPDHLNIHSSYEEYKDAKKNIFKHQKSSNLVVINEDNEVTTTFIKEVKSQLLTFSSYKSVANGYYYSREDGFIKKCQNKEVTNIIHKSEIKLRGIHNYENICAALSATSQLVNSEEQIKAIKEFKGVEHRLEFVRELNNVKYYNDSIGTSPASTIAGLNSFDENIILLAGGSDKGLDYEEIGYKIAEKVGTIILCGPTSNKIEEAVINGNQKFQRDIRILHSSSLEESVLLAKETAKSGDVVLLSPASASFDAFKNFAERGEKFKEYVNRLS